CSGTMPDSYGASLADVGRRGPRMLDARNETSAKSTTSTTIVRIGRYALIPAGGYPKPVRRRLPAPTDPATCSGANTARHRRPGEPGEQLLGSPGPRDRTLELMAPIRRIPAALLTVSCALLPALAAVSARASTEDDLNAARGKLAEARAAATAAAADFASSQ